MKFQQHIILDGYNFIFRQTSGLTESDDSLWQHREALISRIISYRGNKRIKFTIVFDGQDIRGISRIHRPHGIQVAFSRAPMKADPLIISMVSKAVNRKDITVITSDRELALIIKELGCLVQSSELFASKLEAPKSSKLEDKYNVNISPRELDEWKDLFGLNKVE